MASIRNTARSVYSFIRQLLRRVARHDLNSRGAELSYYLVMSMLTALVTLVYAAHFIPGFIRLVNDALLVLLPETIQQMIINALTEVAAPRSLSVIAATTLTTVWFASRAMYSIMTSFNIIYCMDQKHHFIKAKILSILFTLALIGLFILMFFLSIMQDTIISFINSYLMPDDLELVPSRLVNTFLSLLSMLVVFTLLYFYLPNKRVPLKAALPGAAVATVLWFLLAKGFSYYVNNITNYSWILGSLGSIFVFAIWIDWCSTIILLGAEVNAYLECRNSGK
jgi:membrane protein